MYINVVQFSGVHEIPHKTLRAFVDALAAGHAASLPAAALESGTTPLGSGGYATVYSATLSSSCDAGAEGVCLQRMCFLVAGLTKSSVLCILDQRVRRLAVA